MACHRSRGMGGGGGNVRPFDITSQAWASATSWQPPPGPATLTLRGISSLLRCPHARPAQIHIVPRCLGADEARSVQENARVTHSSLEAQRALARRRSAAAKAARSASRGGRRGAQPPPPPSPPEPVGAPSSMISVDTKRLGGHARELLWGALHSCLLPSARRAYPGLPAHSWDNYSHFLGVRLHTPSVEGEKDYLHLDSTFFTAICSLSDAFDGGGTFFPTEYEHELGVVGQDYNATGVLLRPPAGSCLFYDGALLHAANPVARWGERAIAIFFFQKFLGKVCRLRRPPLTYILTYLRTRQGVSPV